ncbi:hypothetical protein Btru_073808 [Bulinus truncatus]|nr:hypothetical protein Btru_073808 [Bulinus truncatus]
MSSEDNYILKAKKEFKYLFHELALRAHRGAVMMYRESDKAEKRLEWGFKYIPRAFCGLGITARILQELGHSKSYLVSHPAKLVTLILAAFAFTVEAYIDNTNSFKDYLLIHKAYNELVKERAEITSSVIVPYEVYQNTKISEAVDMLKEGDGIFSHLSVPDKCLLTTTVTVKEEKINQIKKNIFGKNKKSYIVKFQRNDAANHGYLGDEDVINRAHQLNGRRWHYHAFSNNCEHYVRWCLFGEKKSEQVYLTNEL